MLHVAWQVAPPGGYGPVVDINSNPTYGATLYTMRDVMNYEASAHSSSWASYFYIIEWYSQRTSAYLHYDIAADVSQSGVGVVAEVNAGLMPNWGYPGGSVNHDITIIGYDDTKGIYYYTDTCAHETSCGSLYNGGIQQVSQAQMWNAITSVPPNTGTAPNQGDGGWIW